MNKYKIAIDNQFNVPKPPSYLNGASYTACANWVNTQAPENIIAYSVELIVPPDVTETDARFKQFAE